MTNTKWAGYAQPKTKPQTIRPTWFIVLRACGLAIFFGFAIPQLYSVVHETLHMLGIIGMGMEFVNGRAYRVASGFGGGWVSWNGNANPFQYWVIGTIPQWGAPLLIMFVLWLGKRGKILGLTVFGGAWLTWYYFIDLIRGASNSDMNKVIAITGTPLTWIIALLIAFFLYIIVVITVLREVYNYERYFKSKT